MGQKQMVAAIANSLTDDDPTKRLSVIEAGTGTGKTVGYLIAALPIAFGAWEISVLFSALNGGLLIWRIKIEEHVLAQRKDVAFKTE